MKPLIIIFSGEHSSCILHDVPFGIVQIIAIVTGGLAATKYRISLVISGLCLVSVAGFVALATETYTSGSASPSALVGYYLSAATFGICTLHVLLSTLGPDSL